MSKSVCFGFDESTSKSLTVTKQLTGLEAFRKKSGQYGIANPNGHDLRPGTQLTVYPPKLGGKTTHTKKGYTLVGITGTDKFFFISTKWLKKGTVFDNTHLDFNQVVSQLNEGIASARNCYQVHQQNLEAPLPLHDPDNCSFLSNPKDRLNAQDSSSIERVKACRLSLLAKLKHLAFGGEFGEDEKFNEFADLIQQNRCRKINHKKGCYKVRTSESIALAQLMYGNLMNSLANDFTSEEEEFLAYTLTGRGESTGKQKWTDRYMIMRVLKNRHESASRFDGEVNVLDMALESKQFSMYNAPNGALVHAMTDGWDRINEEVAKAYITIRNGEVVDTDPPGHSHKIYNYYSTCMHYEAKYSWGCATPHHETGALSLGGPRWRHSKKKISNIKVGVTDETVVTEQDVINNMSRGRRPYVTHIFYATDKAYRFGGHPWRKRK